MPGEGQLFYAMGVEEVAATVVLVMAALYYDVRIGKIPNRLTGIFIMLGFILQLHQHGVQGLGIWICGVLGPVAALLLLYALRMLGAGDVKLFAAIGAVMGLRFALAAILGSFLLGGVLGIGILIVRKNGKQRLQYLAKYIKTCILTLQLVEYREAGKGGQGGNFPFMWAAVPAVLLQMFFAIPAGFLF